MTTALISSNLELHRLNSGRVVPVVVACRMLKQMLFRYQVTDDYATMPNPQQTLLYFFLFCLPPQGYIGAALILGGVDNSGAHLYSIHPHGSTDKLPFVTMGSGSLAAMAVLESRWKPDLSVS